MPAEAYDLEVREIGFVDEGGNQEAFIELLKSKGSTMAAPVTIDDFITAFSALDTTQQAAVLAALQAAKPAASADNASSDASAPADMTKTQEVAKRAAEPAPNPQMEELAKNLRESNAAREELAKRLAAMEDDRLTSDLRSKFATSFPYVAGMSSDQYVDLMKSKGLSKQQREIIDRHLTSTNAQNERSALFHEHGSIGSAPGSPEGQIEAIAKNLRDKDPKLTPQQAYAIALRGNAHLYEQTEVEKRRRA